MLRVMVLNRVFFAALVAASFAVTTGCDFFEQAKKEAEEQKEAQEKDDEDAELAEKLNKYIPCFNRASKSVLSSRRRYLSWVDPEKGPQGNERLVYGLYKLNSSGVDACKKGIDQGKELEPELDDLEKQAKKYKKALEKVEPVVAKAHKYYDRDDYKGDKMAQGKALHKELVAAFTAFVDADNALRKAFAKHKRGMAERELKRIKKHEGKSLHWHARKLIIEGKALIEVADVAADEELDQKKLKKALDDYEEAQEKLAKYAKKHKAEVDKVGLFSNFVDSTEAYLKAAKSFQRRVRDKQPFSRGEQTLINAGNAKMVEGHSAHMVDKYNTLIDRSNSLRWP